MHAVGAALAANARSPQLYAGHLSLNRLFATEAAHAGSRLVRQRTRRLPSMILATDCARSLALSTCSTGATSQVK
ncbi:hypothetical protein ACO0LF_18315 [Undibacterium sp. Di27W]|uniref:hypothetical protein n=1 Tax=Undibacterium sp. Di27W TaxID=3413036 RepID=UPI003BF36E87